MDKMEASRILQQVKSEIRITRSNFDLSNPTEYANHSNLIKMIGDEYMGREFRDFEVDDNNRDVLKFLLYYFNDCPLAEDVFPEMNYKVSKQIMLVGKSGCGKNTLMNIFAMYLRKTKNPNAYSSVTMTQLMNHYACNNNIDKYTFNEGENNKKFEGNPINLCLHDLGIVTLPHYKVNTKDIMTEWLFARNDIFINQWKKAHITTNLSKDDLVETWENETRIVDRFKTYNLIELKGESRRKNKKEIIKLLI